jgi:predicted SnoaL-like aldol condensation-catalyzing enzyme
MSGSSNKEIAKSFLEMAASGRVKEAYDKYVALSFIHHNQYFKGDRKSLMIAMEENHKKNPNKVFEIKQVLEDGNRVATYSKVIMGQDDLEVAVVHIFKFENGLITELWDLGQPISKDSPNENGIF